MGYHKQIDNLVLALNGDLTSSALTATVTGDLTEIDAIKPIYAYIEFEKIEITAISGQDITIVRGINGTSAVAHLSGVEVEGNVVAENVNELIDGKVDKEVGKGLSTNDFTNLDKGQIATNKLHTESTHAPTDANNYIHPSSHAISMITDLQTNLDAKLNKSVLTSKGDIFVRTATDIVRLPRGSDGQVLVADDTEALGVKWTTPNVYGAEFEEDTYTPATIFSTTELGWQLFKEFSTQSKSVGKFKVAFHLVCAARGLSYDLRARLVVDGAQIGEIFQLEPKDSGADQRNWIDCFAFVDFTSISTHAIKIEICTSNSGGAAEAHHSVMEIKRVS